MVYLKLIRWPNLIIIALTMILVRYFIVMPELQNIHPEAITSLFLFIVLVLSFVLLAAGGYVINDIVDAEIDRINKPDKVLVGSRISFAQANKLYWVLNILVWICAVYLGFALKSWRLTLIIFAMTGLLWFYSKRYKQMSLVGNIVVSFSTSMALVIVWLMEFFHLTTNPVLFTEASLTFPTITGMLMAYTLFAFLSSMLREIVKDIEDIKGDARFGCKTFPIVAGVATARNLAIGLSAMGLILIGLWQYVLIFKGFDFAFYVLFISDTLLITILILLAMANEKEQFHRVSNLIKLLMVSGILSIAFL
ncbi:MAG: 4-hydroxybenzoate octaprenyltransferase [Bacteroidetes bacterium]|nr:MAG: 4-hydroxybenzoate octaprenyltransferase [Bacteroidota bacterium]